MINLIRKSRQQKELKKYKHLIHKILNNPHNQWILNDKVVSRSLFTFNDLLMPKHHQKLLQSKDIIILPVSGQFSCTVQQPSNSSIVLLFPELIKILSNVDNSRGIAILAHEFGHIYHKHYEKHIPTINAQIEADHFAFELGLAESLLETLITFKDLDSQTRVSILTSKVLSDQHS